MIKIFESNENDVLIIEDGVEKISYAEYSGNENIKKVILPSSIRAIEQYAFSDCHNLESIEIPDSLQYIGIAAFFNCEKLKSIKLPDSLLVIESQAFSDCKSLKKITLPKGARLGDSIFESCLSLKEVVISNGIEKLPYGIFGDCLSLETVNIPISVDYIGPFAFRNCKNLKNINIDGSPHINDFAFEGSLTIEQVYDLMDGNILTPNNVQENKKALLDIVEKYMSDMINKGYDRCYILPNGNFLTNKKINDKVSNPHRNSDYELDDILRNELYWVVKGFNLTGAAGESIFDMLGCIRVNGEAENYILLPKDKITSAQQTALEEWLDWYFYTKNKGLIKVVIYNGKQQITYHKNEYEPKEIIQKINRYYNTGSLYENKRNGR